MPCPVCGDICRCSANASATASPRWLADDNALMAAEQPFSAIEEPTTESRDSCSTEPPPNTEGQKPSPGDSAAWRQEVAARLNRYQSRRKPRPPRYPSLQLRFENQDAARAESAMFPQTTYHALALDEFADRSHPFLANPALASHAVENHAFEDLPGRTTAPEAEILPGTASCRTADSHEHAAPGQAAAPTKAKIIEFPRSWTPPIPPVDQLAEPVMRRPRILEVPETAPPPPALGGITIEPAQQSEMEKRPGIDIPLQSAPLGRRIVSAAIDDVIIAAACFLFGFIFWKMTALRPPRFQILGIAVGLSGLFWAAYQYLLLVHAGTTPGLRLARLELSHFDGSPASRRTRRWRVLASFLSALSLGMGYAWVFLDEDVLCWHDRITHTYLAPKNLKCSNETP
jgi:uncharacterized RDD family membrane protein YckC